MERHTQAPIFTQELLPEMLLVNIAAPEAELMEELHITADMMYNNEKYRNYQNANVT
jgi:hypothetical protein